MTTQTTTSYLTSNVAIAYARSIASGNNTYMAISNPFASNSAIETAVDSAYDRDQVLSTLIAAYRIQPNDVAVMAPRIDWASGQMFERYSQYEPTNCFVVTLTSAVWYVYKCLDNNNGGLSTVKPTGVSTSPFMTSDGYVWQYMWSFSNTIEDKFASTSLIPVVEDANVKNAAVGSTVDSFIVVDGGRGYANYLSGTFSAGDVSANSLSVTLSSSASSTNGFYNNCILENTNPTSGDFGAVRTITSYNGSTRVATIDTPLTATTTNDNYEIRPKAIVVSTGSNNAIASAMINTAANTVTHIVVHSRGSGHIVASANVFAHASVGVSAQANVSPIVSPLRGHGADVFAESRGTTVVVAKTFNGNTAFNTSSLTFATASLVVAPSIDGVVINGTSGQMNKFNLGESLIGYRHVGESIGQVNATPTTITATGNNVLNGISQGDTVIVANTTAIEFATVSAVTNATSFTVYGPSANISGDLWIANAVSIGSVRSTNSSSVSVSGFPAGTNVPVYYIAGATSKRYDTVANVAFVSTAPATLTGVARIEGTVGGTFVVGETVTNGSGQTGQVVGITPTGIVVFTSLQLSTSTFTGQSSGATVSSVTITPATYTKYSGVVNYLTNSLPINITANKTINVKVAVTF